MLIGIHDSDVVAPALDLLDGSTFPPVGVGKKLTVYGSLILHMLTSPRE